MHYVYKNRGRERGDKRSLYVCLSTWMWSSEIKGLAEQEHFYNTVYAHTKCVNMPGKQ